MTEIAEATRALPPSADTDPVEDGRHKRSAESRKRIIEAMLALVQEGHPEPGAEAVAARAGVGLRTVFRLFRDMESLCAEMLVPQRQEFVECFLAQFNAPRGAPRVLELFDRLSAIYEKRMPLRRAGTIRRYSSPSLAGGIKELDSTVAAFLELQFSSESAAGKIRLNTLNLLMSYDTWMRLRDSQGLSFEETTATLRAAFQPFVQES